MPCNFVTGAINFISFRQFSDIHQHISKLHFKLSLCPIQLPTFASLLLFQQLKEIMQSLQIASVHFF